MPCLPVLFAFRTSLAVILAVVVVGLVLRFVIRTVADATTWLKDELVDEYRDLRKNSRKPPIDEQRGKGVLSEDGRGEGETSTS
jgi:hypothetical protein